MRNLNKSAPLLGAVLASSALPSVPTKALEETGFPARKGISSRNLPPAEDSPNISGLKLTGANDKDLSSPSASLFPQSQQVPAQLQNLVGAQMEKFASAHGISGQNTPPVRRTPPHAAAPLPAPTIWAWGNAAHGLQGGLRLRNADGRVGSGTLVILDVAARNATRKSIAVVYDDPNEVGSNSSINFISKGAITRVEIGLDGLGLSAPLTRVLKPGQAITIRELRFQTYDLPHHTPELALPQWIVFPRQEPTASLVSGTQEKQRQSVAARVAHDRNHNAFPLNWPA